MSDLFQLVRDHIEAFDQITQDWQTATGTKKITQSIARPAAWIERVHERGVMTALDCVSIIVFALDDWSASPTREQQIQLTEGWAAELRKAAQDGEIQPRDPFTLLPLNCTPDGWAWGILSGDADKFLTARGMDWNCGEIAAHIYNQVLPDIDAKRFPVELRPNKHATTTQTTPKPAPVMQTPASETQEPVAPSQVLPRKTRSNLLTPLIEAAQRQSQDPTDTAAVWLVLNTQAERKVKPLVGVTESGLKWIDHNDDPQFLSLKNLRDRINRKQKKPR